ncbi:hypothetical protein UFOVP610_20 [uncultured Caudovirales phage]|uniref:HTH cro/C1-type domain-containing protein n=1 Tax=uncultured Caudovirales phage TaxID=2100421 RepID=A0A6J5N2L7_9CAUD|nr:hypothetical protein UFOVP610_20 [uncultured Caudovirales phage]
MTRTVERKHLDEWIDKNGPDGALKLAKKAGVSSSLLLKARAGRAPVKGFMRAQICKALGVSEDELFPIVEELKTS